MTKETKPTYTVPHWGEAKMLADAANEIARQTGLTWDEVMGAVYDAQLVKAGKERVEEALKKKKKTAYMEIKLPKWMAEMVREKAAERGLTADEMLEKLLQQGIEIVGYQEA